MSNKKHEYTPDCSDLDEVSSESFTCEIEVKWGLKVGGFYEL